MKIQNQSKTPINAVLFDLDGTLLDTARDLGGALNAVLNAHGKPSLPMNLLRTHVSRGAMSLVRLGFDCDPKSDEAAGLLQELLDQYSTNLCVHTRYFDGIETLLDSLDRGNRKWGIVTNKAGFLTNPLLTRLGVDQRTNCIVSGDTLPVKKPDPAPLLHACDILGAEPAGSIYIGDDRRDIEAGNRAGMTTLAATYGYILEHDDPALWGADGLISHPDDVHEWLS